MVMFEAIFHNEIDTNDICVEYCHFLSVEGCCRKDIEANTGTPRYMDSSCHHSAKFTEPKYKVLCPSSKSKWNSSSFI
jgi:hypothetical protein